MKVLILKVFFTDYSSSSSISIKPSLYYQFILLRLISRLILKVNSMSLCLLIIRINKLLLVWSSYYSMRFLKKIYCLLDYLIFIKIKFLINNQDWNSNQKVIRFSSTQFADYVKCCTNNSLILATISNRLYYRQYLSIKLVWLNLYFFL